MLKAVYVRAGRPSPRLLAAALASLAAVAFVAAAVFGDARLVSSLSLLMSLVTLVAVVALWDETRRARAEARRSHERTEVTFRRVLAAVEAERLAAERRHAARVPGVPERIR